MGLSLRMLARFQEVAFIKVAFNVEPVDQEEHHNAISAMHERDPHKYWTVAHPSEGSKSYKVSDEHGNTHGYFSLKDNGDHTELGGLANVSGEKGVGGHVMDHLKSHPKPVHLDAFSPLDDYYGKHGFKETDRLKFDRQYAPKHWSEDKGTPDVVFMRREPSGSK